MAEGGRVAGGRGFKEKVFMGCHSNLRKESTDETQPWGREGRKNVQSPKRDQDEACHQCCGRLLPRPT